MELNLARILTRSSANGPGERFVIWAQGCPLGCLGCWNPDTWSPRPRMIRTVQDLFQEIVTTPEIEGVTFTGGEPFIQAAGFAELAALCQSAGLSVFVFSGFELSELRGEEHQTLLKFSDVLVAGRYKRDRGIDGEPWIGSSNQTIHWLSSRYSERDRTETAVAEFSFSDDGTIIVTGFPPSELLRNS